MPIYEYECRRCAHRFELLQKFSDKPRKRCPECSGAVDRLISSPAIRFKGTGWYVTDYADKKKSGGDGADSGGGDGADSAATEKSEGKPAAKAEGKSEDKKAGKKKKEKKAS